MTTTDLSHYTVSHLKWLTKKRNLKGCYCLTKQALIDLILNDMTVAELEEENLSQALYQYRQWLATGVPSAPLGNDYFNMPRRSDYANYSEFEQQYRQWWLGTSSS